MKLTVFVGISVDGFLARLDGSFDFLPDEPEPHGFEELWASIDAMLIGRKTYETMLNFGGWGYGKKPVFVLSSQPLAPAPAEAVIEHLSGDPVEIFKTLNARGCQHIYIDGAYTIQEFIRVGLVNRLIVTRVPVLIGTGIPLFGDIRQDVPLKHIETRTYPSGLVQSEYEIETKALTE